MFNLYFLKDVMKETYKIFKSIAFTLNTVMYYNSIHHNQHST
jgi:hypothetical protein